MERIRRETTALTESSGGICSLEYTEHTLSSSGTSRDTDTVLVVPNFFYFFVVFVDVIIIGIWPEGVVISGKWGLGE